MGKDTPPAQDQDKTCQAPEAVQNTAEVPHKAYWGDTVGCSTVQPVREKAYVAWSS